MAIAQRPASCQRRHQANAVVGEPGVPMPFCLVVQDACRLISDMRFDFVLSHFELPDRSAFPLLQKLIGSTASLFFSTRIENGCLWLPTLAKGRRWPDTRVLRPNEFAIAMGIALQDACSGKNETTDPVAAD